MTYYCWMMKIIFGQMTMLLILSCSGYAQTNLKTAEKQLSQLYSKISDSSINCSYKFGEEFGKLIKDNPATINYDFKILRDSSRCDIVTSKDGNLRIYSWDTETGGTMRFFNTIYQYKDNGKVYTRIPVFKEGDPGCFYSKIYTVVINGKTYYLAISNGIYSNSDISQSVSVFTIAGNQLADTARLFKTKTKLLNRIDVLFDFFSVVDRPERPVELITFDEEKKELYIPVVDKKNQVTKKSLVYRLKGEYFEYVGVGDGK